MTYKEFETVDYDHSRIEKRTYTALPLMYLHDLKKQWLDLSTFVEVKSVVETKTGISTSTRYYIKLFATKKS